MQPAEVQVEPGSTNRITALGNQINASDDRIRPVPGVAPTLARRRRPGRLYPFVYWAGGALFVALVVALVVSIADGSAQAFGHYGLSLVWSGRSKPSEGFYGPGILIVGTLITTGVAMVLAVPTGVGVAVFLSELAPRRVAAPLRAAIELLAAVPSIVVGLWALLVLKPVFQRDVEPFLAKLPGLHWLFGGPAYGSSVLLASVVLAVMTLPTVVALSRTALGAVPVTDREAARSLGATRWQVIRTAVLPASRSGLAAAVTLAVGRALGESIAVAMVIGNRPAIPHSLLAPGATLGSAIVNQFAEASPGLQTSVVVALGAVLLLLTVVVNVAGQAILSRGRRPTRPAPGPAPALLAPSQDLSPSGSWADSPDQADPIDVGAHVSVQARARATLGRRRWAGRAAEVLCMLAAAAALAPLAALIWFTLAKGAGALSLSFLTHAPRPQGIPGGGISTAITGSARIVGWALVMAVPVGLAASLLLYERRGRVARAIRFAADVMTGVPSILVGVFAYTLLVETTHRFSTVAAAFALAVLMVPIMIRVNEEALSGVALELWEAGIALGARRAAVARRVVLRQALPGVVAGNLLAAARGVGETAPLLFTVAAPTSAMTLLIFTQATQAYSSAQRTAWGAALVLMLLVALFSAVARALAWGLTRKARP